MTARRDYRVALKRLPEEDGGGWHAIYPAFGPAAAQGDGPTKAAAIRSATEALDLVMSIYQEDGDPLPTPDAAR